MLNFSVVGALQFACSTLVFMNSAHAASEPKLLSDSLFHVVQVCKQTELLTHNPFPCLHVELGNGSEPGFAVVPTPGAASVLMVPIRKLSGIESPELLSSDHPNWWEVAWAARDFLIERTQGRVSRNDIALAVNSREARSQDQLHIHVACVNSNRFKEIRPFERSITSTWSTFPIRLASENWLAMRVEEEDLESNPFVLLAKLDAASRGLMGEWGIAVIAWEFADGSEGFLIFATRRNEALAEQGSGVALLDPGCSIATE
jgi:CDP-diacylglycerol pyrophosphatase